MVFKQAFGVSPKSRHWRPDDDIWLRLNADSIASQREKPSEVPTTTILQLSFPGWKQVLCEVRGSSQRDRSPLRSPWVFPAGPTSSPKSGVFSLGPGPKSQVPPQVPGADDIQAIHATYLARISFFSGF